MRNTTYSQHSSEINSKAWRIRRNAAKRFNCKVMEISWKECLRMAKECCKSYLDKVVRAWTASKDFEDLLTVNENYNPTLATGRYPALIPLANAFDYHMECFGKPNRIYRSCHKDNSGGFPPEMKERILREKEERRIERARKNYKELIQEMRY